MKTSCDCSDKPKYSSLELANRIDKCVDIVSRQENTIDAQEHTIENEIKTATEVILQAIHEIEPGTQVTPIPSSAIDALFGATYIVKRYPDLDEEYGKCVWAYVLGSINMSLDDDLNTENLDLNYLFFSDTDEIENKDIVLNRDNIQYSIEGYYGNYVTDEQTSQLVFKGDLLRIIRIV